MCVVSMITDHYRDRWTQPPYWPPSVSVPERPNYDMEQLKNFLQQQQQIVQPVTNEEIAEFRKLLERAREYDKRNNEPACELEEKRTALLGIAKVLGVEIDFL